MYTEEMYTEDKELDVEENYEAEYFRFFIIETGGRKCCSCFGI